MNKFGLIALSLVTGLAACSSSSSDPGPINPENPSAVSEGLGAKVNGREAVRVSGNLPSATVSTDVLKVETSSSAVVANGEEFSQQITVESDGDVSKLLLKVVGSSDFLRVDVNSESKATNIFDLLLAIPQNILDGTFCVTYAVQTASGQTSEPSDEQCITVESTLDNPQPTAEATASPTASPVSTATSAPTSAPSMSPTTAPTAEPTTQPTTAPSSTPMATETPEPTSPPGTGDSAAACFNGDFFTQGTRIVQTYKSTTPDGTVDFTDDRTVTGPATYNGQQTTETTGTTTSTATGSGTSTTETATYASADNGVPSIEVFGSTSSSSTQVGSVENENTISPPRVDRFNLSPGESQTQMYTISSTTSSFGQTFTSQTESDVTRTYVGRTTVTVPAGTYETCQFQESGTATTTANGQTSTGSTNSTNYFDVGTGVLIKSVSGDTTTELVEATINGAVVR